MLLYIIRHGIPDYATDSLTERGWLQAEAVGKRLAKSKIDRIFTSPMGRARQTAEPACRLLGLEATVEDWAHEIGDECLTTFPDGRAKSLCIVPNTRFRERDDMDLVYDRAFENPWVSHSGMEAEVRRVERCGDEFLERLGYKREGNVYRILRPNEEKVALFCHAIFGKTWLSTLLRIPFHIMWSDFCYSHTGVTILEFENHADGITAPNCLSYCDLSHIYAENLPLLYDDYIPL